MISKSFLLVLMPIVFSMIFLTVDSIPALDFEMKPMYVEMLEVMIGSTIIGGTANAGYKRFAKIKQTIANVEVLKIG